MAMVHRRPFIFSKKYTLCIAIKSANFDQISLKASPGRGKCCIRFLG